MSQPAPLTDEQLNDIDARHQAATPGPWGQYTFGGDTLIEIGADLQETGTGYRARREICRLEDEPMDNDPTHREWTGEDDWVQVQADAAFIAHAPADVAALLAEVRRLRAHVAQLDRALGTHTRGVLRNVADMADPEAPEVSFFGDMVGPSVAAWLRMIGDHPETVARLAAVPAAVALAEG
ncbi:hypothetical protein [Streptomyces chartreusis]|uniref:hypothetical protein n=1 Tax=Streptomyces chartreusis TaxID=1969 RepID=UPI0036455771